ncbi:MAG: ferritin family protein [Terriglobales bacterium]
MQRDFASLSPREALRIAILVEERNTHIYHRLGEMFSKLCPDSPQVPSAFFDLANTERQHGVLLTARYSERFGALDKHTTAESTVDLIEVPRLGIADILVAVEAGDVPSAGRMAYEMALAAEQSTLNYYARLAETTPDPDLKALYKEFVTFEQAHTDWLEQALGELGPLANPL